MEDITAEKDRFQNLSCRDFLTGLYNSRYLETEFSELFSKAVENDAPAAILFLDLDEFKPINDTYGHHIGDRVLRNVADRLVENCGKRDKIVRLGGDEFAVLILEDVTKSRLAQLVLDLSDAVLAPMDCEECTVCVDVSIGVGIAPDHGYTIDQLTKIADLSMYKDKQMKKMSNSIKSRRERDQAKVA